MVNNSKYAIVLILLIGIAKLLQVTFFNTEKYAKPKPVATKPILPKKSIAKSENSENEARLDLDSAKVETPSDEENAFLEEGSRGANSIIQTESRSLEELKNSYLMPIIAQLPEGQLREDLVIRYYQHEKDGDKVYALRDLGYYIHEKEATETVGKGSNMLYYGDGVQLEDIQIVALTLLEEGLTLKAIRHTRYDWKVNAIEIGTDTLLLNSPTLSSQSILEFTK